MKTNLFLRRTVQCMPHCHISDISMAIHIHNHVVIGVNWGTGVVTPVPDSVVISVLENNISAG